MGDPEEITGRVFRTPESFCAAVFDFLETRGSSRYDDAVTQLEHALQTAGLAESAGASDELIVAALLHDIGHLLLDEHDERRDFLHEDLRHETAGAQFLRRRFGPAVAGPVGLHVAAKRYLVVADPAYAQTLSSVSVRSLAVQGGPMSGDERRHFEALPHAAAAVALRRWDDAGKVRGSEAPPLAHFAEIVARLANVGLEPGISPDSDDS